MTWTKLDDGFYDHPKVLQVGNAAAGVFARALSYCGKHNTDGFIPLGVALMLAGSEGQQLIDRLVSTGLWKATDKGYCCNYLQYNPSKAEVAEERRKTAERVQSWRDKKKCNAVTNTVTNAVSNASPSRPVPTRPDPLSNLEIRESGENAPARDTSAPNTTAVDTQQVRLGTVEQLSAVDPDELVLTLRETSKKQLFRIVTTADKIELKRIASDTKLTKHDFDILGQCYCDRKAWPRFEEIPSTSLLLRDSGKMLLDGIERARQWYERRQNEAKEREERERNARQPTATVHVLAPQTVNTNTGRPPRFGVDENGKPFFRKYAL